MEVLDYIERDLNTLSVDNAIYYLSSKKEYNTIRELLDKDYGFLDIVVDFEDYSRLEPIFKRLPKDELQRKAIKNMIITDYFNYTILNNAGIEKANFNIDVKKIGDALFNANLTKYFEEENAFFSYDISLPIKEKLESLGLPYARIHFLLDNVKEKRLQKNINDLLECRSDIAMLGYTTSDLLTYKAIDGREITSPDNFVAIANDAKIKKLLKERRNKK